MQDEKAAVAEARRAVTELGAKGFSLGGANLGGRELDDPAFFTLYETCCELDVPLYIHGFTQARPEATEASKTATTSPRSWGSSTTRPPPSAT